MNLKQVIAGTGIVGAAFVGLAFFGGHPQQAKAHAPAPAIVAAPAEKPAALPFVSTSSSFGTVLPTKTPKPSPTQKPINIKQAFEIGDFAPDLKIHIDYPLSERGESLEIGTGSPDFHPVVLALYSSYPKCACGPMRTTMDVLAHKYHQQYGVDFINLNSVLASQKSPATEQYGFEMAMHDVAIGTELYGARPPHDVGSVWGDGIAPSVIVVDHDHRVHFIARGKDAAQVGPLENAIRESIGHYRRSNGLAPV